MSGVQKSAFWKLKRGRSFAGERKNIRILADDYRVRAEKYEVLGKLPQSERAFFITGYAPAKDTGRIEESLTKEFYVRH